MPYIARHAEHVAVFQRTANWVLPMEGYRDAIPAEIQWLFDNVPLYWNWYSYNMHFLHSQLEGLQECDDDWVAKGGTTKERNDTLHANVTAFIKYRLNTRTKQNAQGLTNYPPPPRRPT